MQYLHLSASHKTGESTCLDFVKFVDFPLASGDSDRYGDEV